MLKHSTVPAGHETASAKPEAKAVHSPAPMRARRTRKLSDVHEAPDTEAAAAAGEPVQVRSNHLPNLLRKPWLPEATLCLRVGLRDAMLYEEGASRQWRNAGRRPISVAMPEKVWQQI